ncbi:MAG: hypothetical protein M0R74_07335 [Dehalococcoidia bacterium]|nr:hypothetical protein [Dehalococcoidia bacterium]
MGGYADSGDPLPIIVGVISAVVLLVITLFTILAALVASSRSPGVR